MIASRVEAFCRARGTGAGRAYSGLTPPFRRFRRRRPHDDSRSLNARSAGAAALRRPSSTALFR
jgi:hypothetical protein